MTVEGIPTSNNGNGDDKITPHLEGETIMVTVITMTTNSTVAKAIEGLQYR